MDRRTFLRCAGGIAGGATIALTGGCVKGGTRYYITNIGNDHDTGLSPLNAWRSVARVNRALHDRTIGYGDSILFRRGEEFFGEIAPLPPDAVSAGNQKLTISAYGEGDRPKISGYKIVHQRAAWSAVSQDVWRVDITDDTSYRGNLASRDANVGFLRVDGLIFGAKKHQLGDLNQQWDFFSDGQYLYVKSVGHPGDLAEDFRIAVNGILITGYSGLAVAGLELVGCGGHGYQQRAALGTSVTNCRIHEIGGSYLYDTHDTRYGNGVELWMGSSDAVIAGNEIYDIYDVACTIQGWQEAGAQSITRCTFRSNQIFNCTQALEFWAEGGDASQGSGIVDCSFEDNTCINAGESWSYAVRDDPANKGNFVMVHGQTLPIIMRVARNVFFNARDCYLFVSTNNGHLRDGITLEHNVIALRRDIPIQAGQSYTIEQSGDWCAASGQEADSRWLVVPPSLATQNAVAYVRANSELLRTG